MTSLFPFGGTFTAFEIMFSLVFLCILTVIIVTAVRGILLWNKNNHSPRLSVPASIVSKRMHVSRHRHANAGDVTGMHGYHSNTSTAYYVTFQVESGDRMELHVQGNEYGMLAEGDHGMLTFQGTRYLGFERR